MYEINGIVYAGESIPQKKVIFAQYEEKNCLRIHFNTGEIVLVNFAEGFSGKAFEPLKNVQVLRSFSIEHGVLTWQNGEIDVAPEYLLDIGIRIADEVTA